LRRLAAKLRRLSPTCGIFAAVGRAFGTACAQFESIDVLVSGATGNFLAPINELSPNGFRVVVDIDLIGTFHVMRAAFPHLTKPGASVINITAPQSFIPMRYQANVCAGKAGVDQMTRSWLSNGLATASA
jgi:NAD(P)-dependent dehydrogenase (short-subunit alcohol dehydrogenase family)